MWNASAHLSEDLRTTIHGAVQLLQDYNSRAVSHDETVALRVERSRGLLGLVVSSRQGLHVREAGYGQWSYGSFGATCDHHIGPSRLYQAKRLADRVGR